MGKEKEKEQGQDGERKGKGTRTGWGKERKGKRTEQEKEPKKMAAPDSDHLMPKAIVLLSFCFRSWILCIFLFSGHGCKHQKKDCSDHLGSTFLVTRIHWRAITTIDNERKRPQAPNSYRTMSKSRTWISRVWTQLIRIDWRYLFFLLSFFEWQLKIGSWGTMEG